jgi:plasmid stabilization system protein ParE
LAAVVYSARALAGLERAFEFLAANDPRSGRRAVEAIRGGVESLADHPLVGRPTSAGLRELVISFGRSGYLALYWYAPERDEVQILAIRHQRELDFHG